MSDDLESKDEIIEEILLPLNVQGGGRDLNWGNVSKYSLSYWDAARKRQENYPFFGQIFEIWNLWLQSTSTHT